MDSGLSRLILDYQVAVRSALKAMRKAGITMPFTYEEWIQSDTSVISLHSDAVIVDKHGRGCRVRWNGGIVDFDFGDLGEIDGFDPWRLYKFAGEDLQYYGFEDRASFDQSFAMSVELGDILYSGNVLYYLKGGSRKFAVDVDIIEDGDLLPHRDLDGVLALYIHYFNAADLMRKNYEAISKSFAKRAPTRKQQMDLSIYLSSWLGFLAVTCEGYQKLRMRILLTSERPLSFQELIPQSDALGRLINMHKHKLRNLRNNIFHLREDLTAIRDFFCGVENRLEWARTLHVDFEHFFSDYRILCEVHYLMNNRRAESDV